MSIDKNSCPHISLLLLIILVLVQTPITADAQPENHWFRTMGGDNSDYLDSIVAGPDGYVYIVGYTNSYGAGYSDNDGFIAKLNSTNGTLVWFKIIGGDKNDFCWDIDYGPGGYIYVTGSTSSYGEGNSDIFVAKLDVDGNIKWFKTIGRYPNEDSYGIVVSSDGNIYIMGRIENSDTSEYDIMVAKLDVEGNLKWIKKIGGTGNDYGFDIDLGSDGNILVSGETNSYGAGYTDAFVVKVNSSDGSLIWFTTMGEKYSERAWGITVGSDSHIYVAGFTYSFGASSGDAFVAKLASNGSLIWFETLGTDKPKTGKAIEFGPDAYLYLVGYTYSYGAGANDIFISKMNSSGDISWFKTVGGEGNDYGWEIDIDLNGYIYIGGYTTSYGVNTDAYTMLFSASIGSKLYWIDNENWDPVETANYEVSPTQQTPTVTTPTPSVNDYSPITLSIIPSINTISPDTYIAEDNVVPSAIPEPWFTTIITMLAMLIILVKHT